MGRPRRTAEEKTAIKHAWYLKNRDVSIARAKTRLPQILDWAKKNRPRLNARMAEWRKTPEGIDKAAHDSLIRRFAKHGLTLDQYHSILERQDFSCAICNEVPMDNYGGSHDGFHIDHHHVTKQIRGLLCKHCNVGIGMLKDSARLCRLAADYLDRFSA